MITVKIDDKTPEGKELLIEIHKRSNAIRKVFARKHNGTPQEYMTADEWRSHCKKIYLKFSENMSIVYFSVSLNKTCPTLL